MKKLKFYIKGTIYMWLPILGGYIANIVTDLIIKNL